MEKTLKKRMERKIPSNDQNLASKKQPETVDKETKPTRSHNVSIIILDKVVQAFGMKMSKPLPIPQYQSSRIRNLPAPELPRIKGRPIESKEYTNRNGGDRPAPTN